MHPVLKVVRELLVTVINRIDSGDYDASEEDCDEVIAVLRHYTEKDVRMSKYQACEYLHVSRATFDNYVADGKIPKGTHQLGFKELSWKKKDLYKFKEKRKKE